MLPSDKKQEFKYSNMLIPIAIDVGDAHSLHQVPYVLISVEIVLFQMHKHQSLLRLYQIQHTQVQYTYILSKIVVSMNKWKVQIKLSISA